MRKLLTSSFSKYLVLSIVVFWGLTLFGYSLQHDALDVYLSWRFYGSDALINGEFPLWNYFQDNGYPFYSDLQYSIWNPEFFIVSLFGRYNATTVAWLFVVYMAIGGSGFRFLLKQFKISAKATFIGGVLFMLSGILVGHGQSIVSILGAIWLPWAIGSYIQVLETNFSYKATLQFVVWTFLMLVAGYQAVSIMLFYVFLVFFLVRLVQHFKYNKYKLKRFVLGHLVSAIIIGALMSGTIVSLLEVFPYLERLSGVSMEQSQKYIVHPKSFFSFLYPYSTVLKDIPKMDISMQNMFVGIVPLYLFVLGLSKWKAVENIYLKVLGLFAIVFGVASFGGMTPFQPLLFEYVPGLDLFLFPVFYRYFTWIFVLILIAYGVDVYRSLKKSYLPHFIAGTSVVYLLGLIIGLSRLEGKVSIKEFLLNPGALPFTQGLVLESLLFLAVLWVGFLFVKKWKELAFYWWLIIPSFLMIQLVAPITLHSVQKQSDINAYLETRKPGFFNLNTETKLKDYPSSVYFTQLWRNIGNFNNEPSINGFTSFQLRSKNSIDKNLPLKNQLLEKSFAFAKYEDTKVDVVEHSQRGLSLEVISHNSEDTLFLQQNFFPGWKSYIDGEQVEIKASKEVCMAVPLKTGKHIIEFVFEKESIGVLFYGTNVFFLLLLFLLGWSYIRDHKSCVVVLGGLGVLFVGLLIMHATKVTSKDSEIRIQNGEEQLVFKRQLTVGDYENIRTFMMDHPDDEINVRFMGYDNDLKLLDILSANSEFKSRSYVSDREDVCHFGHKDTDVSFSNSGLLSKENPYLELHDKSKLDSLRWATTRFIQFQLGMDQASLSDSLFLVLENNRRGQQLNYEAIPLNDRMRLSNGVYYHSFLLGSQIEPHNLKAYLWNNSDAKVRVAGFKFELYNFDVRD